MTQPTSPRSATDASAKTRSSHRTKPRQNPRRPRPRPKNNNSSGSRNPPPKRKVKPPKDRDFILSTVSSSTSTEASFGSSCSTASSSLDDSDHRILNPPVSSLGRPRQGPRAAVPRSPPPRSPPPRPSHRKRGSVGSVPSTHTVSRRRNGYHSDGGGHSRSGHSHQSHLHTVHSPGPPRSFATSWRIVDDHRHSFDESETTAHGLTFVLRQLASLRKRRESEEGDKGENWEEDSSLAEYSSGSKKRGGYIGQTAVEIFSKVPGSLSCGSIDNVLEKAGGACAGPQDSDSAVTGTSSRDGRTSLLICGRREAVEEDSSHKFEDGKRRRRRESAVLVCSRGGGAGEVDDRHFFRELSWELGSGLGKEGGKNSSVVDEGDVILSCEEDFESSSSDSVILVRSDGTPTSQSTGGPGGSCPGRFQRALKKNNSSRRDHLDNRVAAARNRTEDRDEAAVLAEARRRRSRRRQRSEEKVLTQTPPSLYRAAMTTAALANDPSMAGLSQSAPAAAASSEEKTNEPSISPPPTQSHPSSAQTSATMAMLPPAVVSHDDDDDPHKANPIKKFTASLPDHAQTLKHQTSKVSQAIGNLLPTATISNLTTRKYTMPDKTVASQVLMYRQLLHTECKPGLRLSRKYQGTTAQKAVMHMPWWEQGVEQTGKMVISYDNLIVRLWLNGAIMPYAEGGYASQHASSSSFSSSTAEKIPPMDLLSSSPPKSSAQGSEEEGQTQTIDTMIDQKGLPPVPHPYWVERLGFQQTDPVTDFRSGGVLSLAMLVHIVEACPSVHRRFLPAGDAHMLPFGITNINVTDMIAKFLMFSKSVDRIDALLSSKPFWRMFADPNALLVLQELSMEMLADVVVEMGRERRIPGGPHEKGESLHGEREGKVTVFDFPQVLERTERRVRDDLLGAGPKTVDEMRSIAGRLRIKYTRALERKERNAEKNRERAEEAARHADNLKAITGNVMGSAGGFLSKIRNQSQRGQLSGANEAKTGEFKSVPSDAAEGFAETGRAGGAATVSTEEVKFGASGGLAAAAAPQSADAAPPPAAPKPVHVPPPDLLSGGGMASISLTGSGDDAAAAEALASPDATGMFQIGDDDDEDDL